MKELLVAFIVVLLVSTSSWAEDTTPLPSVSSDELKVEDLPKPIVELVTQLQHLSREIEHAGTGTRSHRKEAQGGTSIPATSAVGIIPRSPAYRAK
jgi:hypothetical protein